MLLLHYVNTLRDAVAFDSVQIPFCIVIIHDIQVRDIQVRDIQGDFKTRATNE